MIDIWLSKTRAPVEIINLALVGILYLPCLSTISVLAKDFGSKAAVTISLENLGSELIAGGLAFRIPFFPAVTLLTLARREPTG